MAGRAGHQQKHVRLHPPGQEGLSAAVELRIRHSDRRLQFERVFQSSAGGAVRVVLSFSGWRWGARHCTVPGNKDGNYLLDTYRPMSLHRQSTYLTWDGVHEVDPNLTLAAMKALRRTNAEAPGDLRLEIKKRE
mmetsp:Transcript_50699/g.127192  ORF Transcript_50699/g.127192 Transcript_50699/m.127192 type:complete len:134 (+) Transcript_50699:710-1111(+)